VDEHSIEIDSKYHIKIVDTLDEFRKLKSIWNDLVGNHKSYVPYLCHEWFEIWLKHFLKQDKLLVLLLYNKENLAAIAPFLVKNEKFKGIIKVKKIELIGNITSPIRSFIVKTCDAKKREDDISAIFRFFSDKFRSWDIIDLNSVYDEFLSINILRNILTNYGLPNTGFHCFNYYYINGINYSGEDYLKKRSKKLRENLRRRKRNLEKKGKVEFNILKNPEDIDHCFSLHYKVRDKSWKSKDINAEFLKDFAKLAGTKKWLRFGFALFDGDPIASQIRIVCNNISYFVSTVYDASYNEYSPGSILISEMIKYLIDIDKVIEMDYLYGDERYKKEWLDQKGERKGIYVFNRNYKGWLASFLMIKFLPIVKKIKGLKKIKIILSKRFLGR